MSKEIDFERLIIESSVIFVSIFSTIGLLTGALYHEFKYAYIYLGYMLYYSFPFILASFWAFISLIRRNKYIRNLSASFFLTGLISLIILASLSSQTAILPEKFMFLWAYQGIAFIEIFMVICIFVGGNLIAVGIKDFKRSREYSSIRKYGNSIESGALLVLGIIFIIGFYNMATGVNQTSQILRDEQITLKGKCVYCANNFTLATADQVKGTFQVLEEGVSLYFALLNEQNYQLWNSSETPFVLPPDSLVSDYFTYTKTTFFVTVSETSKYYLIVKSELDLPTNVTYRLEVYKIVTSGLFNGLILLVISAVGLNVWILVKTDEKQLNALSYQKLVNYRYR